MHQVLTTVNILIGEHTSLEQNAVDNLRLIREGLSNISQNNDFVKGLFYLRLLNRHLSLKLNLQDENSKQIVQLLLSIITNSSLLDLDLQAKYCRALSALLKKSKSISGISIEWRELYSLINKVHFERESIYGNNGKITMKYHGHIIMQLVRRSRNYFSPTSSNEIMEEIMQYISPHDLVSSLRYMSLLNVFLPVSNNFQVKWIEKLFQCWDLIENCSGWDFMLTSIFSRVIKGTYSSIDWSAYSNILFTRFLRILDVGVTNSKVGKPDKLSIPSDISLFIGHNRSTSSYIAKCIIYMFNVPNILILLTHLLSLLQDFYHPSNHGYYSDSLAYLIRDLPYYYSKLIYKQQIKPIESKNYIEQEKFIEILLPIVTYGLYSKSNTMNQCVRSSIKYLTHINSTKVISSLMNNIFTGLENVSNSNQSISMTELLATIIGEIIISSENKDILLEQLLFISLNGIDVTDDTKTKATFKFYHRLFSYVPINSTVLPSFEDFIVQFFDKVVHLLSNKDKEEKGNSSEFWWPILFKQTFRSFWFNLSKDYFDIFIKKLDLHLKTSVHINAIKEYGYILQNASYVNSERVLQIIIPYYHKDLVKDNKLQDISSQELIWKLSIVRNAVKYSKESIIKYKTQILDIIRETFTSDSKEVIRYSAKLLRSLLRSLLNRYPLDYKCVADSNNLVFPETIRDYDYKSATISWHIPSKEQIALALEIATIYLNNTHKDLSAIIEQGKVKTSSLSLWKLLLTYRSIFLSCSELISYDSTLNSRVSIRDNEDQLTSPLTNIYKCNLIKEKIEDQLILQSIEDVHKLLEIINKEKQDDTIVLKSIINTYSSMLLYRGGSPNKLRKYQAFQSMLKSKYANFTTNKKYHSRTLRIDGSLLYYLKLQNNANYGIYLTTLTKKYISDILLLISSNYTSVRQHALEAFVKFIKQYPFTSNEFLPDILTNLFTISSNPTESVYDTIEGILALLSTKTVLRKITAQWKLTSQFMLSLLNCVNVDKPLIQIKVFQLFMAFCVSYHHQYQYTNTNTNDSQKILLSNLCDILNKSATHWKYQLMGLSWIYLIFNNINVYDINSYTVLLDIILKYSVSEITVIRYLSQRLLCKLLDSLYSFSTKSTILTLSDIETSPLTLDKSILNINGEVTVLSKLSSITSNAQDIVSVLSSKLLNKDYLSSIIQLSIQDHHARLKSDFEKRNNSGGSDIASKIMGVIHRFGWGGGIGGGSSMVMEDSVASDLINELSRLNDIWPHTKPLKLTSVGFTDVNALLWSSLFRTLGYPLLSLLVNNNILKYLCNEELEKQCILSEILAGLVRSSKHSSDDNISNMWTVIIPIIKELLQSSTVEGISEFTSMLRFMCFEMDPRRLKPLIQLICYSKIISEEFTSSSQAKHILFLKSLLTELNWKILQVNIDVLNILQQNLQHPYKQVRQAIGECLSQVLVNISYLPKIHTSHAIESFVSTIRSGPTIMEDNEDQNKKIQSQYRETILHWIVCSIANGDAYSIKYLFLPLLIEDIFIYQRDSHEEVSKLALHATALISQCYDKNLLIFDNVFKSASNTNWHIRSAILPFLQIYVFNHVFLLNQDQTSKAINIVVQLLEDSQVEVRELARVALSSLIKSINFKQIDYLSNLFASSIGKKKDQQSIQKRHAGILGYCALVEAYPYDLLEWMPPILTELAKFINDPQPIKETVKKTFQEFWRTRVNDSWPLVQNKFTEDQLYTIKELLISPSYYA